MPPKTPAKKKNPAPKHAPKRRPRAKKQFVWVVIQVDAKDSHYWDGDNVTDIRVTVFDNADSAEDFAVELVADDESGDEVELVFACTKKVEVRREA